jgi:REP element-mobilizing transposase RayT
MPRKLRVEVCGYHHIMNYGVAENDIFLDDLDKEKFLAILAAVVKEYKINVHSFALLDNHYHLMIENRRKNLSNAMRQLNSLYAMYFNKKYKRAGHLWQGRYHSWYLEDKQYFFNLFKFIELNPLKAHLSQEIGEYKYSATYCMLKDAIPPFLQNSFILREYDLGELFETLSKPMNEEERKSIEQFHSIQYKLEDEEVFHIKQKSLDEYSLHVKNKDKRNEAILQAFEDGYTKSEIAKELSLSVAGVSKIIKKIQPAL